MHSRSLSNQHADYLNQQHMMQPPVPYQQFEYTLPTTFHGELLPSTIPEGSGTSSTELFTASEQNNLFGFLEQFEWQFDPLLPAAMSGFSAISSPAPPLSITPVPTFPQPNVTPSHSFARARTSSTSSASSLLGALPRQLTQSPSVSYPPGFPIQSSSSFNQSTPHSDSSYHPQLNITIPSTHRRLPSQSKVELHGNDVSTLSAPLDITGGFLPFHTPSSASTTIRTEATPLAHPNPLLLLHSSLSSMDPPYSSVPFEEPSQSPIHDGPIPGGNLSATTRPQKPVLSTPEKRYRHIQSEQRRRNTIRDGYGQLTSLLAPHPAATSSRSAGKGTTASGKPRRNKDPNRPKGARGRTRGKGKSGVLFKAVEYIRWLEENVEDLGAEVEKLEIAAGDGTSIPSGTSQALGGSLMWLPDGSGAPDLRSGGWPKRMSYESGS